MRTEQLTALTRAFAAAGAALRAAHAAPHGYRVDGGTLVVTDRLLADKTLRMIEAGAGLPDRIELQFAEAMALARYLLLVVEHVDRNHPLIADHPLLTQERGAP